MCTYRSLLSFPPPSPPHSISIHESFCSTSQTGKEGSGLRCCKGAVRTGGSGVSELFFIGLEIFYRTLQIHPLIALPLHYSFSHEFRSSTFRARKFDPYVLHECWCCLSPPVATSSPFLLLFLIDTRKYPHCVIASCSPHKVYVYRFYR